ncbi:acyl-CoA thioesterase domain-containing protein [Brevibacterium sp. VCM10]|uniref:acyl-CoA thioesterase domain-containing protein n=1 Tax=Brevibacterium sp. VCM10 TaxID=1381751 RepID=UPI00047139B1|nr:acyl-CoA thioesterase domain-containing protein [Brevibacterium sp. VCM10]
MLTFFQPIGDAGTDDFLPLPGALAHWGGGRLHGPAVAGLLARSARLVAAEAKPGFVPGRSAVELFRATRDEQLEARTELVREGSRILVVDAVVVQRGRMCARAHFFFFRPGAEPENTIWAPGIELPVPEAGIGLDAQRRCYRTESTGWDPRVERINGPGRKYAWQEPFAVVAGEEVHPFDLLVATSDLASMSTHWDERGIEFINTDATMSIVRLPDDGGIGVTGLHRIGEAGVSAGSAVMYDRAGPLALSMVSALAQTSVRVAITAEGFATQKL